jgi:hypothetical protein
MRVNEVASSSRDYNTFQSFFSTPVEMNADEITPKAYIPIGSERCGSIASGRFTVYDIADNNTYHIANSQNKTGALKRARESRSALARVRAY